MIPLRVEPEARTLPAVTLALVALNSLTFVLELGMGATLERFIAQAGVVPALYTRGDGRLSVADVVVSVLDPELGIRVLASMFLHGGWLHVFFNLTYLFVFGGSVEERFGHGRYLALYLLCGFAAAYTHVLAAPGSTVPLIGASGAIAGVLGAQLVLYPRAEVVLGSAPGLMDQPRVPAFFFLAAWFLLQFLSGVLGLVGAPDQAGGVAWWAHVGGFAAGAVAGIRLRTAGARPRPRSRSGTRPPARPPSGPRPGPPLRPR